MTNIFYCEDKGYNCRRKFSIMKLMTMLNFVKWVHDGTHETIQAFCHLMDWSAPDKNDTIEFASYWLIVKYMEFLSQTPKLGHFIPTDLQGNILEEPKEKNYKVKGPDSRVGISGKYFSAMKAHEKALERVLFPDAKIIECEDGLECIIGEQMLMYKDRGKKWRTILDIKTLEDCIRAINN